MQNCQGSIQGDPSLCPQLTLITSEFPVVQTYWVLNPVAQVISGAQV